MPQERYYIGSATFIKRRINRNPRREECCECCARDADQMLSSGKECERVWYIFDETADSHAGAYCYTCYDEENWNKHRDTDEHRAFMEAKARTEQIRREKHLAFIKKYCSPAQ